MGYYLQIILLILFSIFFIYFIVYSVKDIKKQEKRRNKNVTSNTQDSNSLLRSGSSKKNWGSIAKELWENEQYDEFRRRVTGALERYNPEGYFYYGKLLLRDGNIRKAGVYFFFSGLYTEAEQEAIDTYLSFIKDKSPSDALGTIPNVCKRIDSRTLFPDRVFEEMKELPFPDWFKKKVEDF